MKTLLIIYSHWFPSNLAGVHRARLIGNYLKCFEWKPRILTVDEKFYEEQPDYDFEKTFSSDFQISRVKAFPILKPRLVGDIGLRAFLQLYKKALNIIKNEKIDFVWIPIPSFYQAVLGRLLYEKTKIPYGIDYIDPWIRDISGRKNLRAVLSNLAAGVLEPYALKKAALISGVSELYYLPAIERNFKNKHIENVAMPYGFDPNDHLVKLDNVVYPWNKYGDCKPVLYAGAFLPKSGLFIKLLFNAACELRQENKWDKKIQFLFIGTGSYIHKSIESYAKEAGIGDIVTEIRERKPFLNIINYLDRAWRVMVIGSTEKHYTASKTFQALLSKKPVFTMFHEESSAAKIMNEVNADQYTFRYSDGLERNKIISELKILLTNFIDDNADWKPDFIKLEKYSAKESACQLVEKMNRIINSKF